MRVIEGLDALPSLELPPRDRALVARSVVAVGVFDGMHLGHQRLIHELLEMASELESVPTVITFANHPDEILSGRAPEPLISVPHRLRLLRRAGVQRLLLLTFDEKLRAVTAASFAEDVLARGLQTTGLLLGFDSAFGKDREGTPDYFRSVSDSLGFEVRTGQPVELDGAPISSTKIRAAIHNGDLDQAYRLLGRRPAAFGEVIAGERRGRGLGFPTANLRPECQVLPPGGVYAVEVLYEGEQFAAVANLGTRPTFTAGQEHVEPTLEVHLLTDISHENLDLYGSTLEVAFIEHLRAEQKFADGEALRAQISLDIAHARRVLGS